MSIMGNMVGSYSQLGKTFVLQDESGNELVGVVTEKEQIFDATSGDVKIGKTFASDGGVDVGTDTRTYRTIHGTCLVLPSESFSIPITAYDGYDYTKFQAIVSVFNTTILDSTITHQIVLYDAVYNVDSTTKISNVTKNATSKSIELNFTNNTDNIYIVHYNTYKEE